MNKFLLIETSTKNCSVALAENDKIIDSIDLAADKYLHSEKLHPFIDEILKRNDWQAKDLSAVGVGKGPGSYTGLRIGVSAAKGICYALDIPLIAVSSLEILARGVRAEEGFIVPMIDARRMEAYTAVFNAHYEQLREIQAEILDENAFKSFLDKNKVYFAGDAVEKAGQVIKHSNAVFTSHRYPQAKDMLVPFSEKFNKGDFENVAYFEPFYLKDFVAKKKKNIFGK
jgi:tRNA threonylcarbamoyladenosine biosynthesis protein TsaB